MKKSPAPDLAAENADLRFLGECGWAPSGEDFFRALARYLAQSLGANFVCIDRLQEGALTAQTEAIFCDGRFQDNVTYALKDTPCGEMVGKTICCFARDVRGLFPKDLILQEMLAEGYLGTTLWSAQGQPIGLIALIWRQPLADTRLATSVLQLVAVRAAGELERRQAESALRESRERIDLALLSSRMATFDWDIVRNRRTWSHGVHALLGTKPETFAGTAEEFFQIIHPEDRSAVQSALARAVETTGEYETEYRAVWPDGRIRHISARGKVHRDSAGRAVQMTGVCWDITERKRVQEALRESELRYRTLFNTIDAGFCVIEMVFDAEGRPVDYRFLEVNAAFEKQTGLHDAQGRLMRELAPAHEAHWFETYGKIALTGEPLHFVNEARALNRWYDVYAYRVGAPEGRQVGILFNDITAHKQAEAAVQQLNAELRQRVLELQAANEEVQASRRGAVNLMDDAVHARKQAEQATADFRSAAEQRRLALEAANLGAWDYHFQTGEVFWDERCREMWGIPQAETISYTGAIAAIHPEDRADVDKGVEQALAGKDGGAFHREFRIDWPDGSVHWIASHGRVYFQGEGHQRRPVRFVGANQDITQRRQREEQLHNLNRTLKANSKSDQALMRAQGEAEYLKQVCRIVVEDCGHGMVWVGFAEEDEFRTVRPAAQAGFEEGYLETLNVTWADTERGRGPTGTAIRTGQPCMCGNMMTDPTFAPWRAEANKRGYASSLVLPLLAEGRAFGALTIYSRKTNGFSEAEAKLLTSLAGDLAYGITALRLRSAKARAEEAQRQSEERYRGLVELSPEALFVNRGSRIVLVNPAALQLFGASSAEQLLGKSPFEFFHPDCHAMMQERISLVLSGERVPVLEEKIIRLDGALVDVEVIAAPVMDQGERAIQVLLRDITERKRAQAALQHTTEDLQRSNRDLEQFAYIASHDLQEPLRAVGGYVKLLEHRFPDKLDVKALGYIAGAFDGATRMEQLIGDLLAFSRVASRGDAFLPSDLEAALGQALLNLEAGITSAQAIVTHDPLPTLSVDAGQIRQLFQNLIGNALKFHGEQSPEIHIGAQRTEGRWVFSVRDNGIGIDPQYYERIFQIFQRLHTRKDYPGTGIGLAICKKIVERHGGTIWVESQPGQGATFYFSIPDPPSAGPPAA
jgi:PAS domain S-box-containing protein